MNTRLPGITMLIGMLAISADALTAGPARGDSSTKSILMRAPHSTHSQS
jgi:hypothetical protein